MINIINYFYDKLIYHKFVITPIKSNKHLFHVNLISKDGMIDIEFINNKIYVTIDSDYMFHHFEVMPTEQDIDYLINKINLINKL